MAVLEENHWLEAYLGGNDWVKHNSAVDYFGKKYSKIFYAVAKAHLMTQNDSLLSIESTGQ